MGIKSSLYFWSSLLKSPKARGLRLVVLFLCPLFLYVRNYRETNGGVKEYAARGKGCVAFTREIRWAFFFFLYLRQICVGMFTWFCSSKWT